MSEPRWNNSDSRPPPRQPPRKAPGARPTSRQPGLRPRPGPPPRPATGTGTSPRWGNLPWQRGVVLVASAAGLGALITIITGRDPGFVLGFVVLLGTVAACAAVSPRRAYLIIPAPAIAYLVAAMLTGLIHDRASDTSRTELAINAARWVASEFLAMVAATTLAVLIAGVRWLISSRRPTQPRPRPIARERDTTSSGPRRLSR